MYETEYQEWCADILNQNELIEGSNVDRNYWKECIFDCKKFQYTSMANSVKNNRLNATTFDLIIESDRLAYTKTRETALVTWADLISKIG